MGIYLKIILGWSVEYKGEYLHEEEGRFIIQSLEGELFNKKNDYLFISTDNNYRIDNTLDYYLYGDDIAKKEKGNKIRFLNHSIFGYEGENFVLDKKFKELNKEQTFYVSRGFHLSHKKNKEKLKELMDLGFNKNKPMIKQVYRKAPKIVMDLAKKYGIEEKDLLKIRPTFAVFRS